jgi:nucleotide-binding universal stress UspA family protein
MSRNIVVGIDHEELGDAALRAAFALASAAGDTRVHAVNVRSSLEGFPVTGRTVSKIDDDLEKLRARVEGVFAEWREKHPDGNVADVSVHVTNGRPAVALIRTAAALSAGLIVVGTHGRGRIARALVGSVANEVVAKANCPVLVVRGIDHRTTEALADVEPACPACEARRAATDGAQAWCDRHAEHHPRAHVYSYSGPSNTPIRPWGF